MHPSAALAWQRLQARAEAEQDRPIAELFAEHHDRFEDFSAQFGEVFLDYSKNAMSPAARAELLDLLEARDFRRRRVALLSGEAVNGSENRPALHTALRDARRAPETVAADVQAELERLGEFVEAVRSGTLTGTSGKPYTDVVNIGIGGSLLGPQLATRALARHAQAGLACHFVSDPDGCKLRDLLPRLDPETTLFILASKTFTTAETLANARIARSWLAEVLGEGAREHFVGVSARPERMDALGIAPDRQFRLWDWVGGRYSLWSAIGLSLALSLGMEGFRAFLAGAAAMDAHFETAEPAANLPVLLALSHVWHASFLGARSLVNLPYQQRLKFLPAYLQQLEMESLGKRCDAAGRPLLHASCPMVFGQVGNNAQHSFMQLLHQGTERFLVDFIAVASDPDAPERLGLANCLAQSRALMLGTGDAHEAEPHRRCPGNRPSNTLLLTTLTPASLGQLLALYEHKVFVQGLLWDVNAYDQWGVELGKRIADELHGRLREGVGGEDLDASTAGLLKRLRQA
ncbi:MAG: glucose-6-phosphate isomerase [Gammaproteobacteria bacterium]|nr:glucose-6-phosphate isomerase [Gammaproteobacteria bacterium]